MAKKKDIIMKNEKFVIYIAKQECAYKGAGACSALEFLELFEGDNDVGECLATGAQKDENCNGDCDNCQFNREFSLEERIDNCCDYDTHFFDACDVEQVKKDAQEQLDYAKKSADLYWEVPHFEEILSDLERIF